MFEKLCDSEFKELRDFTKSVKTWKEAVDILEAEGGAAWRFLFRLLARGRLADPETNAPLKITPRLLIREFKDLFKDV